MPDQPAPGYYLGFDFGLKYIGIAIGQTISKTSNPVSILDVSAGIDWQSITSLIKEWSPSGLVVGVPLTADGKTTDLLEAIERFSRQLSNRYHLPVYHIDEHLSSHAAKDLLNQSPQRKIDRLDDAAAAVILQTWLNQHHDNDRYRH